MRSTYRKLGPYIREVVERNSDLQVEPLLGVSVSKVFIPSIANTIGTDMSRYKIVRENQFAYGPVTSRNSDKVSIALLGEPECIISTSYTVFEIIDEEILRPEYLMMWFRRTEFDRYARFKSHGSVRELFGWDEMCDVELPIPSVEKQREITEEYQTVVDRIQLNERLNEKLEEAAQAIYKQWFVDFDFPMTAVYTESIGKPELAGQPHKSGGGEMEYNEVLEQNIPKGWEPMLWGDIVTLEYGKGLRGYQGASGDVPVYGTNGIVGMTVSPMWPSEGIIVGRKGVYRGVRYSAVPFFVIDTAFYVATKRSISMKWAYREILRLNINDMESGSAIPSTSRTDFYERRCLFPSESLQSAFDVVVGRLRKRADLSVSENQVVSQVGGLLLSSLAAKR